MTDPYLKQLLKYSLSLQQGDGNERLNPRPREDYLYLQAALDAAMGAQYDPVQMVQRAAPDIDPSKPPHRILAALAVLQEGLDVYPEMSRLLTRIYPNATRHVTNPMQDTKSAARESLAADFSAEVEPIGSGSALDSSNATLDANTSTAGNQTSDDVQSKTAPATGDHLLKRVIDCISVNDNDIKLRSLDALLFATQNNPEIQAACVELGLLEVLEDQMKVGDVNVTAKCLSTIGAVIRGSKLAEERFMIRHGSKFFGLKIVLTSILSSESPKVLTKAANLAHYLLQVLQEPAIRDQLSAGEGPKVADGPADAKGVLLAIDEGMSQEELGELRHLVDRSLAHLLKVTSEVIDDVNLTETIAKMACHSAKELLDSQMIQNHMEAITARLKKITLSCAESHEEEVGYLKAFLGTSPV